MHTFTTIDSTTTGTTTKITRDCSCGGWWTIATIPEPAHHTPLAEREAAHLREIQQIADGSVWRELPDRHRFELHLRRHVRDQTPHRVVITAVWTGGSRDVLVWPWTDEGLAAAQEWCDTHLTFWPRDEWTSDHHRVEPNSLAAYAT